MKFKLDENVDVRAAAVLGAAGHDVTTVVDQDLGGSEDPDIAQVVAREDRILVTLDRGFGDIRRYPPGAHPGIVLLRLRRQARPQVEAALRLLLGYEELPSLAGCTFIVTAGTVRVRRPRT